MSKKINELTAEYLREREANPGKRLDIYPIESENIGTCMADVIANHNAGGEDQKFAIQNPDTKKIEVHIPSESMVLKALRGTNRYSIQSEIGVISRNDRPKSK